MQKVSLLLTLLFILFLSAIISAQTPTPIPPVADEKDVVKISTTLIQIDATVTDKKGNIVKNLKPEDFEVYENGKKQPITNFSFVSTGTENQSSASSEAKADPAIKNSVSLPPIKLNPEQVRRTYALVVDDLGLSAASIYFVQEALKKFLNEQMQEGDLVAIVRTGSGIGALQSFTSDKRQLMAAINKLRWNPQGRGGIGTFDPFESDLKESIDGNIKLKDKTVRNVDGTNEEIEFKKEIEQERQENFSVGTLGALNYIIRGMRELPGRKSLMVFSEGFHALTKIQGIPTHTRIFNMLRNLTDLANRSSVVIYTFDPRGLVNPYAVNGDDEITNVFDDRQTNSREERADDFADSQNTLRYLAYETGGMPLFGNDLNSSIRKAINDQNGYYLIGYQPDEDTFDPKKSKFNNLTIKLKQPNLKIRYRSGFYGIADEKLDSIQQTPRQRIIQALTSPFSSSAVNLSLYPIFTNDEKIGSVIHALVYIDAKNLKFIPAEDGKEKANFDIIAMTFGDNGNIIGQLSKNYTVEFSEKIYKNALQNGFVYELYIPVKKSGAYQFRIALRDTVSDNIGSASQFVDIPDLKNKRIFLSNFVLNNYSLQQWKDVSTGKPPQNDVRSVYLDSTQRKYKRGSVLRYGYEIYNPKMDSGGKPNLLIQTRLIREGKIISETPPIPFAVGSQTDLKYLDAAGAITLGRDLTAGQYFLQVIVTDENTSGTKKHFATQSVDFEVVE